VLHLLHSMHMEREVPMGITFSNESVCHWFSRASFG
jgi:hypothetical protein